MLYISVVEDEQVHRDILTKYIEEWKLRKGQEAELQVFSSSEAFYFMWCGDQRCDVVFLDIMMGGETNGISLAKQLREKGKPLTIIFTTGIIDYMQEGYEVEAMHYLLKPLDREKVWECLDKCCERKAEEKRIVLLPTEDGLLKAEVDEILYGEACGHYCQLACKRECLQVKIGIKELAQKLEAYGDFHFCHRSYLVNVRKIAKVGREELAMDNGAVVPVSRRLYQEINACFIEAFIGKENRPSHNVIRTSAEGREL